MKSILSCLLFISAFSLSATTIEIWTSSENVKRAIDKVSKQFEVDFKAKVKTTVLNKDLTNQFKTAAMAGKGPDIFCWAHDVVGELAQSGLIEPINLSQNFKDQFLPVALDAYTYNGRIYGYPYDIEAIALIYNKDLLKELPKSFDELLTMAKRKTNKKKDKYFFLYDFSNFFFSFPFIGGNGGYIFKSNNGSLDAKLVGLNNPGAVTGVKYIETFAKEGIIPTSVDRNIAFNKMTSGKLAATIDGPWSLGDLRKSKINYAIAPIPAFKNGPARPFVGTHGFIIRRGSKNKELAKELIEKYFVSKKGIMTIYKEDPRGPSRKDALKELSKKDNDLRQFMASAQNGIPMPNIPAMGSVWGAMGNALKLIITGKLETKAALDIAVSQIKNSNK